MDLIEDEMDAHGYEDLVPLDIKLALEDKVFGWTHLSSAFIGHTLFTVGAYCLVYEIVTLCLYELYGPPLSLQPNYIQFLRVALSLWAAIGTYRMVRRRRRVWFRAPYGSKAYKQDAARRRQSVAETDRTTALGRMMQRFRHRRELKKLRKAETQFAKKHNAHKKKQESSSRSTPVQPLLPNRGYSEDTSSDNSSGDDEGSSNSSEEVSYSSTATATTDSSVSSAAKKRHRRHSFHTTPTSRMQSVALDQVLFPAIHKMPYAHGGFFGAAPFMLANPHWISILRHLMPDVYVEISRRVAYSPASRLIHWAENNPVVAAYGAAHELEYHSEIPNLEWDVFLDPQLVHRVQVVLDERDKFLARHDNASTTSFTTTTNAKAKHILAYYEEQLKRRSHALVDKMLIAHGNLTQLILELSGHAKNYNYSRVKRTRRTLGGGIYARQWMAVFAEALKLGVCFNNHVSDLDSRMPKGASHKTASLMELAESKSPQTSMAQSIRIVESITKGKQPVGLVLDLKSRHVPKHIWSIVVDTLRAAGIRVEGIASFGVEEIRDVSRGCAQPVQENIFFHSAGDLQKACHEGRVRQGDKIFFNAGCLLWDPTSTARSGNNWNLISSFDPQEIKDSYRVQPFGLVQDKNAAYSSIQMYKEHYQLSIGMYCQEFAVDEAAVHLMARLVNEHPEIYDLGFSWGGVNGITVQGIAPGRFTSTDGFWNQRHIGARWDYNLSPLIQQQ